MEGEKLKKRERDFENGRGRHGGEKKKENMLMEVQGVTNTISIHINLLLLILTTSLYLI